MIAANFRSWSRNRLLDRVEPDLQPIRPHCTVSRRGQGQQLLRVDRQGHAEVRRPVQTTCDPLEHTRPVVVRKRAAPHRSHAASARPLRPASRQLDCWLTHPSPSGSNTTPLPSSGPTGARDTGVPRARSPLPNWRRRWREPAPTAAWRMRLPPPQRLVVEDQLKTLTGK